MRYISAILGTIIGTYNHAIPVLIYNRVLIGTERSVEFIVSILLQKNLVAWYNFALFRIALLVGV